MLSLDDLVCISSLGVLRNLSFGKSNHLNRVGSCVVAKCSLCHGYVCVSLYLCVFLWDCQVCPCVTIVCLSECACLLKTSNSVVSLREMLKFSIVSVMM